MLYQLVTSEKVKSSAKFSDLHLVSFCFKFQPEHRKLFC
jgi:hypothetical protein